MLSHLVIGIILSVNKDKDTDKYKDKDTDKDKDKEMLSHLDQGDWHNLLCQ